MHDVLAALGLLRREELREELRAELEAATGWDVRALLAPTMALRVGPHHLDLPYAHPVRGTIDAITVALVDGYVRPRVILGVPAAVPVPPVMPPGAGIPLAHVHRHAGTTAIHQHHIVRHA